MADLWEMCSVGIDFLSIWSPGKPELYMSTKDYVKWKGGKLTNKQDTFRYFLEEGWEPFAVYNNVYSFRRKYQG
jgi:hypothetical protein